MDIEYSAKKFDVLEDLRSHPEVMFGMLQPPVQSYLGGTIEKQMVYKRDGSTHGLHVYPSRKHPRKLIEEDLAQSNGVWRWVAQPRIPSLTNAGQIRVFLSGGEVTHILQTTRVGNVLVGCPVPSLLHPSEIRYVYSDIP